MNPNIQERTIVEDHQDIEEDGPNYFLVGGPGPAYSQRTSSKLSAAALHLLLS